MDPTLTEAFYILRLVVVGFCLHKVNTVDEKILSDMKIDFFRFTTIAEHQCIS